MRIELSAEELQVFSIAFHTQEPFEVEKVFEGKSFDYIQSRVTEVCEKYINAGILGSPEFEKLMSRFLFASKIMSVFANNIFWLCIMSSKRGLCARYYDQRTGKYLLWTIDSRKEADSTILKAIKLGDVKAPYKQKACFTGKEFAAKVRSGFQGDEGVVKVVYDSCVNNDLKLCNETNETGYPVVVTTQFTIGKDGIHYLKAQVEDDRDFVETGCTDTQGLINAAFYEIRKK